MDKSSSHSVPLSTNPESHNFSDSMTANPLAVFPDCMIMWDEKELDGVATATDRPASQTDFNSADGSAFNAEESVRKGNLPHGASVPKPSPAPSSMEGGAHRASVQYHIHYHPWNASRLMAAFLAGGAIALMVGFIFLRTYLPNHPGTVEPGQVQALTEH
jgi:hypothetical protein